MVDSKAEGGVVEGDEKKGEGAGKKIDCNIDKGVRKGGRSCEGMACKEWPTWQRSTIIFADEWEWLGCLSQRQDGTTRELGTERRPGCHVQELLLRL